MSVLLCAAPSNYGKADLATVPGIQAVARWLEVDQYRVSLHSGDGPDILPASDDPSHYDIARAARFSEGPVLIETGCSVGPSWAKAYPSWAWDAGSPTQRLFYDRPPLDAVEQKIVQGISWAKLIPKREWQLSPEPRNVVLQGGRYVDGDTPSAPEYIDEEFWPREKTILRVLRALDRETPIWGATLHGGPVAIPERGSLYLDRMGGDASLLRGLSANAYPNRIGVKPVDCPTPASWRSFCDEFFGKLKADLDRITGGIPVRIVETAAMPTTPEKITERHRVEYLPDTLTAALAAGFVSAGAYGIVEQVAGAGPADLKNYGIVKLNGSLAAPLRALVP